MQGKVIDKSTREALENVEIFVLNIDTITTDSLDLFKFDRILLGLPREQHILFSKHGYKPMLVKPERGKDTLVELAPSIGTKSPTIPVKQLPLFHKINSFSLLIVNALTIIFLLTDKPLKRKWIWLIMLLTVNPNLNFFFFDFSLINIEWIHPPVILTKYWSHPFTVYFTVPLVSLVFWTKTILAKFRREND